MPVRAMKIRPQKAWAPLNFAAFAQEKEGDATALDIRKRKRLGAFCHACGNHIR